MKVVHADEENVSRIQRFLRAKITNRKQTALKYLHLRKQIKTIRNYCPRGLYDTCEFQQQNKEIYDKYQRVQQQIAPLCRGIIQMLTRKLFPSIRREKMDLSIYEALRHEECTNGNINICIRQTYSEWGTTRKTRSETYRTGCEKERQLTLIGDEVNHLLDTFSTAIVGGPKEMIQWQDRYTHVDFVLEKYIFEVSMYMKCVSDNETLVNLENIKQIHEYEILYSKLLENEAIAIELQHSYRSFHKMMQKCQWRRWYIHRRICKMHPYLLNSNSPNEERLITVYLGKYSAYHDYYQPYLTSGCLKRPEGQEPAVNPVLQHLMYHSINVHPPTDTVMQSLLNAQQKKQNMILASHQQSSRIIYDDEWYERRLDKLWTHVTPNRFYFISFCADLNKVYVQMALSYPSSTMLMYVFDALRMECLFIQRTIRKFAGCEDVDFEIPEFQNIQSFVLCRGTWNGTIEENEKNCSNYKRLITYLRSLDDCLKNMTDYVVAKGDMKKVREMKNAAEILPEDCAALLEKFLPTFVEMEERFEDSSYCHKRWAKEMKVLLLYIFMKKELAKQNIVVVWFRKELQKSEELFYSFKVK